MYKIFFFAKINQVRVQFEFQGQVTVTREQNQILIHLFLRHICLHFFLAQKSVCFVAEWREMCSKDGMSNNVKVMNRSICVLALLVGFKMILPHFVRLLLCCVCYKKSLHCAVLSLFLQIATECAPRTIPATTWVCGLSCDGRDRKRNVQKLLVSIVCRRH